MLQGDLVVFLDGPSASVSVSRCRLYLIMRVHPECNLVLVTMIKPFSIDGSVVSKAGRVDLSFRTGYVLHILEYIHILDAAKPTRATGGGGFPSIRAGNLP